jgi:KTSC domain
VYRRPVDSTLIKAVGYDLPSCVLEVEFHGGKLYEYYDVPLTVYSRLMAAESAGTYFNESIRDLYSYRKIS